MKAFAMILTVQQLTDAGILARIRCEPSQRLGWLCDYNATARGSFRQPECSVLHCNLEAWNFSLPLPHLPSQWQ